MINFENRQATPSSKLVPNADGPPLIMARRGELHNLAYLSKVTNVRTPHCFPRTCTYLWPWLSVTPVRGVGTCRSAAQGRVDLAVQPAFGGQSCRIGPAPAALALRRRAMDWLLRALIARMIRCGNLSADHRRRHDPDLRRRNRPRDRGPVLPAGAPRSRSCSSPSSSSAKPIWPAPS